MASVYRKTTVAKETASHATLLITVIFILCAVMAFVLLLRFPRSITRPIAELTDGIQEIANRNYDKRLNLDRTGEFGVVSSSFNKMAECLQEYRASTLADILSSKKYIEAIVNSITEPIIGLNKDKEIVFVNDEALSILNLKRENVIRKSAPELAMKNDLLRRLVRELLTPGEKKEPLKIYADNKESYFQGSTFLLKQLKQGKHIKSISEMSYC